MIGDVRSGRSDEGGVGALGGVEHHTAGGGQPEAAAVRVMGTARQAGGETLGTSENNYERHSVGFSCLKYTTKDFQIPKFSLIFRDNFQIKAHFVL